MAPGKSALVQGNRTEVQNMIEGLVIVAEQTWGEGAFVHAFEGSQGGEAADTGT